MTDRIRTTISLDPEVHEIFKRMAEASGVSVSRCMGDWLADTAEGAQFVAQKMAEARSAPKTVLREFQAMTVGLHEEITEQMAKMRRAELGRTDAALAAPAGPGRRGAAPSSNTGLKSPLRPAKRGS